MQQPQVSNLGDNNTDDGGSRGSNDNGSSGNSGNNNGNSNSGKATVLQVQGRLLLLPKLSATGLEGT